MEEELRDVREADPKYCFMVTPAPTDEHGQGALVAQWQQSGYPDVHGGRMIPVTPARPKNPIPNTYLSKEFTKIITIIN